SALEEHFGVVADELFGAGGGLDGVRLTRAVVRVVAIWTDVDHPAIGGRNGHVRRDGARLALVVGELQLDGVRASVRVRVRGVETGERVVFASGVAEIPLDLGTEPVAALERGLERVHVDRLPGGDRS